MGQINLTLPTAGSTPNSTADPEIDTAFTTIQTLVNGNIDATNITAALAQSATVNQAGQAVKGAVNIAASQSTSSTTYTTLATPDQVSGVVLPSNGLIRVWYWATWQESVAGAARAAIFIGANQLKTIVDTTAAPVTQAAATNSNLTATNQNLFSVAQGLAGQRNTLGGYPGDATTGQAVAGFSPNNQMAVDLGGTLFNPGTTPMGGPCDIFAAAGTYAVSVQFKASSGTVTASNRKLWVQALSFA